MTAKKILEMIEGVSPDDTDTLDEIDTHVYVFLKLYDGFKYTISASGCSVTYRHNDWLETYPSTLYHLFDNHLYTRSRDALKAIRPDGATINIAVNHNDTASAWLMLKEITFNARNLPTEELAELHVIIQALEWGCGE